MLVNSITRSLFAAVFCVLLATAAEAQGTWTAKEPAPVFRFGAAAVSMGGNIYEIGGGTYDIGGKTLEQYASTLLQEYDPAADTWRDLAPMPKGLSHIGATSLNGKLYVAGGFTIPPPRGVDLHLGAVDSFFVYDPATNRWQMLAPLSSPRGSVGLAAVAGKIHVVAGRGEDQMVIGKHEVYDLATEKWTEAAPLTNPRDHIGIVVLDGRIHVVGGRNSLNFNLPLHDVFDPATGQWTQSTPLPIALSGNTAAAYRGFLVYAGADCSGQKATAEHEAFDPKSGKWMTLARFPEGLQAFGAASVGDSLYFVGGTRGCGGRNPVKDVLEFKLP